MNDTDLRALLDEIDAMLPQWACDLARLDPCGWVPDNDDK